MASWRAVVESLLSAQAESAAQAEGGGVADEAAAGMAAMRGDAKFMDLYSRQIGAFGLEAMLKLVRAPAAVYLGASASECLAGDPQDARVLR